MFEPLQKTLALAGYGSRQDCDDFITAGRVRVNRQTASLDQIVDPAIDKITIDGTPIAVVAQLTKVAHKYSPWKKTDSD